MRGMLETLKHIREVQYYLSRIIRILINRQDRHDESKLHSPEVEAFEEVTEKLHSLTYGSPDYDRIKVTFLGSALKHHYACNKHHPEHHTNGIRDMNLVDIVEMLCDWKAATKRHHDGDIKKSIEINQARFGYSDELKSILLNTLPLLEEGGIDGY